MSFESPQFFYSFECVIFTPPKFNRAIKTTRGKGFIIFKAHTPNRILFSLNRFQRFTIQVPEFNIATFIR